MSTTGWAMAVISIRRRAFLKGVQWSIRHGGKPHWLVLLYPNVVSMAHGGVAHHWVPEVRENEFIEVIWG